MQNNENIFTALKDFRSYYNHLIALLVGSATLLYVIGWVRAKAYFYVFNADWIVKELTNGILIQNSLLPIVILILTFVVLLLGFIYKIISIKSLQFIISLFFITTLLLIMYGYYNLIFEKIDEGILFLYLSSIGSSILTSSLLGLLILANKTINNKKTFTILIFIIIYGTLISPISIGYSQGIRDKNPELSTLPKIETFSDSHKNFRLLYHKSDLLYLVNINNTSTTINLLKINDELGINLTPDNN